MKWRVTTEYVDDLRRFLDEGGVLPSVSTLRLNIQAIIPRKVADYALKNRIKLVHNNVEFIPINEAKTLVRKRLT